MLLLMNILLQVFQYPSNKYQKENVIPFELLLNTEQSPETPVEHG